MAHPYGGDGNTFETNNCFAQAFRYVGPHGVLFKSTTGEQIFTRHGKTRDTDKMIIERILQQLEACNTEDRNFPPTILYNENWMLRIILDWFTVNGNSESLIPVLPDSKWYSEALLSSAFLPQSRGDKLGENYTHADGVIGHFSIGGSGRGDLVLLPDAEQLIIIEGKMFSRLSSGVTNAKYYDQAARTVGCMAEVLRLANRRPAKMKSLAFYLMAPQSQIEQGLFTLEMSKESITQKVQQRVSAYKGERNRWLQDWFNPLIDKIEIETFSWEDILQNMVKTNSEYGVEVQNFYHKCLQYNRPLK